MRTVYSCVLPKGQESWRPAPGSREALVQGCTCPRVQPGEAVSISLRIVRCTSCKRSRRNEPLPRAAWPEGHVIHMRLDHHQRYSDEKRQWEKLAPSERVAECDCGWTLRLPWPGGVVVNELQDAAIENHWQSVE